jgi:hypothetical protein
MAQVPLAKLGPNKYVPEPVKQQQQQQQPHHLYSASQVVNSQTVPARTKTTTAKTNSKNNSADSDSNSDTISTTSVEPDSRSLSDYPGYNPSSHHPHHQKQQPHQLSKLLNICVDCYQIMDGVVVSACMEDVLTSSTAEAATTMIRHDPHQFRMKSSSRDLIKSAHYNNALQQQQQPVRKGGEAMSNCSSQSDLNTIKTSSGSNSPSIVMQSLSDVELVNNQNIVVSVEHSPVLANSGGARRLSQQQSTPAQAVVVDHARLGQNDISRILAPSVEESSLHLNEFADLSSSASSKTSSSNETAGNEADESISGGCGGVNSSLRDGLTLNLRQVYSQTSP